MRNDNFTMEQVLNIFTEELSARRGKVTDTFKDGNRLFSRSVFPHAKDVRPRDRLQSGIAMKATQNEICIYPYIYRLVCSNGAIAADALESRTIGNLHDLEPHTIIQSLREGIEACSAKKVFTQTVRRMHTTSEIQVNTALNVLAYFSGHSILLSSEMVKRIMDRFFAETDRSQFGLANAVTAEARDTKDPQKKWDLESLGGAIAIAAPSPKPKGRARASRPLAVA